MNGSLVDARRGSLVQLIEAAELLETQLREHIGTYGEVPLYPDEDDPSAEGSALYQLRGSVLFCLRKAKARTP